MLKLLFYLCLYGMVGCFFACSAKVNTNPPLDDFEATFQALLEEHINSSFGNVPGVSMSVIASNLNIFWTGASGFDSVEEDQILKADQPFRIASITKTFVAVAILRLQELGLLNIDETIEKYISEQHNQLLQAGAYQTKEISLRQCLNHTSGFFDYAMGNRSYSEIVMNNPQKRWTRTEQIQHALKVGKPLGTPGEKYVYGDTGYILLGEVIEKIADTTLGYALRDLLSYQKLGLRSTWLETLEPQPENLPEFVHRYTNRLDASTWDASIDLYGGGGLVSTTRELAMFMHSLFNHKIFDQKAMLDLMLEPPSYGAYYNLVSNKQHKDYRQGLWKIMIYGEEAYMHGGIWGTAIIHLPAYNCTISVNVTRGKFDRLLKKVIHVIKNLSEE